MSAPAVTIHGLSKRFRVGTRVKYPTLRDSFAHGAAASVNTVKQLLGRAPKADRKSIWALKDIDMQVQEGEVVGIIGKNGAGKSTLLKILSGITDPTSGYADIHGRVGSLLEVGTGFHMELTGRENIYMNGALLGMRRREIQQKFDEIVAFSEVETYLDTPVKRYSSGMYMRLAFAVAAHLEPDILIVDEVLAVGDAAFQKKCLGKMSTIASEGRTVLFVSHNMASVQSLCSRAVMIESGKLIDEGAPREVVSRYIQRICLSEAAPLDEREDRDGDGSVRMTSIKVESLDEDGVIRCSSRLRLTVAYQAENPIRHPHVLAEICDLSNVGLFILDSELSGGLPNELPPTGEISCVTAPINLAPGRCTLSIEINRGSVEADYVNDAIEFDIETEDYFGNGKVPTREWAVSLVHQEWGASPGP